MQRYNYSDNEQVLVDKTTHQCAVLVIGLVGGEGDPLLNLTEVLNIDIQIRPKGFYNICLDPFDRIDMTIDWATAHTLEYINKIFKQKLTILFPYLERRWKGEEEKYNHGNIYTRY